jgi:predicted dienelactone hydrolase
MEGMMVSRRTSWFVVVLLSSIAIRAFAQQNHIDMVSPLAPELSPYGKYDIGVRTITAIDKARPDIVNTKEGGSTVIYDRTFTLEVWYPARLAANQQPGGEYRTMARDAAIAVTLYGKAVRDAAPLTTEGSFPLVIISHGYPGNRFLMSHLGENLASKGFVTVAIDHKDSTYDDQKGLTSTLYNRSFDQLFVLREIARLSQPGSGSFLAGLADAGRTGIVGYSMGGYGVVNVVGGGYSTASETFNNAPPNKLLAARAADNPEYQKSRDPRIRAAIAVAPWGMQNGFWDAEGLKGIRTPVLFVAGSVDSVAGYERGTRAIFQGAVNADRYLLTFINANHNAGAPIPAPVETFGSSAFTHYADAVWDNVRMNNILDHFATAYFELYLKGDQEKKAYLDLSPQPGDAGWKGFKARSAVGLTLEHGTPAR